MSKKKYSFEIMPKARGDLEDIFRYICENLCNFSAAKSLMDEFDKGFERISEFPFSCPEGQSEKHFRKLIVDNYIAFYKIDQINFKVIVFRVFYGLMDYNKYL